VTAAASASLRHARAVYRVCGIDGFVAWAGNHYAVPYDHVTEILVLRITQPELFAYAAELRLVRSIWRSSNFPTRPHHPGDRWLHLGGGVAAHGLGRSRQRWIDIDK
jgi:hypothetical protein